MACAVAASGDYFAIEVIDDQTGRGVPLVELRTVDGTRHWTDSQGLIAFHEPGLMDQRVFFHIRSHGYQFPADGFGYRGKALDVRPGGRATLRIQRSNLAERLYRVTGVGIYRDSELLGRPVPIRQPVLNAQVAGSDSVNTAIFHGQLYWFWGDTNRPAYPLGLFHVPGATSQLPGQGGLDPARGVDLNYLTRNDGFVAATAEMPGEGPTWIDGLCVVREEGRERMFAKYVKVRKMLDVYERGLVEFDEAEKRFHKVTTYDFTAPLYPVGHWVQQPADGDGYLYFGNPHPLVRVPASGKALADTGQFQTYTCQRAGSSADKPEIDRDEQGRVRWSWKNGLPAVGNQLQARWLASGLLKPQEAILALRNLEDGRPVVAHAGSVAWNPFRQRWVMIAEQLEGTSFLGEIWYAESDGLTGPWIYARKMATHDKYSFYNPRHHPMFDQDGGRHIYFEGTYATTFSGNDDPTPRYDYNQVMYRLDLADRRLTLPVPIYETKTAAGQLLATGRQRNMRGRIVWMAADQPGEGLVPIARVQPRPNRSELQVCGAPAAEVSAGPLFYALPADSPARPNTAPLYAWRHDQQPVVYALDAAVLPAEYRRDAQPLCRVWRYPLSAEIDWD